MGSPSVRKYPEVTIRQEAHGVPPSGAGRSEDQGEGHLHAHQGSPQALWPTGAGDAVSARPQGQGRALPGHLEGGDHLRDHSGEDSDAQGEGQDPPVDGHVAQPRDPARRQGGESVQPPSGQEEAQARAQEEVGQVHARDHQPIGPPLPAKTFGLTSSSVAPRSILLPRPSALLDVETFHPVPLDMPGRRWPHRPIPARGRSAGRLPLRPSPPAPRPGLPASAAREHDAAPYRPGTPRDLPRPG